MEDAEKRCSGADKMKVTFVDHSGQERVLSVPGGMSLVEVALHHSVEGIDAECGGACSCATCHVFVEEGWVGRLPPLSMIESDMLELVAGRQSNSRLACQIKTSEALDGLVVRTPESQGAA